MDSNPLTNYDNTNYNLYKSWMYIFSWGYSPVSLFDILYLARESLLKHLHCYFLLFLGRLLASLLYVCKNSIKNHTTWKNIKSFQMIFFGIALILLNVIKVDGPQNYNRFCPFKSNPHPFLNRQYQVG